MGQHCAATVARAAGLRRGPSCPGCELRREGRVSPDGQWARLCGGGGDSRCPGRTGQHVAPQAQPCHLLLRSSRPPDRASQSCLTVTHQQMYVVREVPGLGVRPSLSSGALWCDGERAVGRTGTACARVPAWGATCVRKRERFGGGPPARRPPPRRRAHTGPSAPAARSHGRHPATRQPRPRHDRHRSRLLASVPPPDGVTQPTAGSCSWGSSRAPQHALVVTPLYS